MKVLWISDFTTADHIGGAEMTSEAIIEASSFDVHQIKTAAVGSVSLGKFDVVVTDSLTQMANPQEVFSLLDTHPYYTIEYDYHKLSPSRHLMTPGDPFLNVDNPWGIWFRRFWNHPNLQKAFFMSEEQRSVHREKLANVEIEFPESEVLSSVLSRDTFEFIDKCIAHNQKRGLERSGWLIYDTPNPLKGTKQSMGYAEKHGLSPIRLFKGMSPRQLLRTMSRSQGLVFHPTMHDTCPRMVIEAMLLGCRVEVNDMVQHKDEEWFSDAEGARTYLEGRADHFWSQIKEE